MTAVRWVAGIRGVIYQPLFLSALGVSVVLGLFASREFESGNWTRGDYTLFAASVVMVLVVAAAQIFRDRGQQSIRKSLDLELLDASIKMRTDFGDALDTAFHEMGELASATKMGPKAELYAASLRLLLSAACQLTGPGQGRIRASFFEYRPASGADPEGLFHVATVGRQGISTFNFLAGETIGDAALTMVKRNGYLLEPDVQNSPPSTWTTGRPAPYEAFLSVTCAIKKTHIGMVSVDSTESADIDEDDIPMVTLIGRMIGVATLLK